jgi:hypothetical protein
MAWAQLSDVRCYYEVLGHGDPLLLGWLNSTKLRDAFNLSANSRFAGAAMLRPWDSPMVL